jgi:uncharacterized cupin superfamily protein
VAHHVQNRSDRDVLILVVGTRQPGGAAHDPDIDLYISEGTYKHKDGTPY